MFGIPVIIDEFMQLSSLTPQCCIRLGRPDRRTEISVFGNMAQSQCVHVNMFGFCFMV